MAKQMKLCGKCAAMLETGYELKKVDAQINLKVTCDHCGKRRYGAVYQMDGKKRRQHHENDHI